MTRHYVQYTILDRMARDHPMLPLARLEAAHARLLRAGSRGHMDHEQWRNPRVGGGAWVYRIEADGD